MHGCSGGSGVVCVVAPGGVWLLQGGAWLLQGACMVAAGEEGAMHGCSWGVACVVAPRGACMVAPRGGMHGSSRGVCMVALGGHAWLLQGGMHGFLGGMHGFSGGMHGFFDEIRSMSGRYASYWNAFLLL